MESKCEKMANEARSRVAEANNLKGSDHDGIVKVYNEWADIYEQDLTSVNYKAPQICGTFFQKYAQKLGFDQTCRILDACTGTGGAAQQIRDLGYTNVDGQDASQDMLDQGVKLNRFNKTYCGLIEDGKKLPIEENTYHAVTIVGAFGYLKCNALLEMIRIVRPGGIIINVSRKNTMETFAELPELLVSWNKSGLMEVQEITVPEDKYMTDIDATVHVLKVL